MERPTGFKIDAHENKPQNCMEALTSERNGITSENELIKKVSIQTSTGISSHFSLFIILLIRIINSHNSVQTLGNLQQ